MHLNIMMPRNLCLCLLRGGDTEQYCDPIPEVLMAVVLVLRKDTLDNDGIDLA